MRKSSLFSLSVVVAVFTLFLIGPAQAHDFWLNAKAPEGGILKADIGFGHTFPEPETIPEERVSIFEPLNLVTPEGTTEMKQTGSDNFHYELKADLKKGSYLVFGNYKPTFWSNGPDGWKNADRIQRPDATIVREAVMFAKTILNVEGADDTSVITKPVGQRFEIVPQVNPATVKPGGRFPVQVLLEGKPVKTVEVKAVIAGFAGKTKDGDPENEYKAFWGRTDLNGMVNIIPLKAGYWTINVEHKVPYADKARCDESVLVASLTFAIVE